MSKAITQEDKECSFLIVDDFASMRQVIRKTLVSLGFYKISEAAGALDAVRKIEQGERFEFIISDWNMPNMNGLELLNYLRASPHLNRVPFLMITAEASRENIIQAAKAGVSQYIVKPFTAEELQEKIISAWGAGRR
jgi:two-component system chemotaxis response regulator CheY